MPRFDVNIATLPFIGLGDNFPVVHYHKYRIFKRDIATVASTTMNTGSNLPFSQKKSVWNDNSDIASGCVFGSGSDCATIGYFYRISLYDNIAGITGFHRFSGNCSTIFNVKMIGFHFNISTFPNTQGVSRNRTG